MAATRPSATPNDVQVMPASRRCPPKSCTSLMSLSPEPAISAFSASWQGSTKTSAVRTNARGRVRVECLLEVVGNGGPARSVVGCSPAPVGLGPLDLGEPARPHPPGRGEGGNLLLVDLRPLAARAARGEALQEPVAVERQL